jgi:hypothetical protein
VRVAAHTNLGSYPGFVNFTRQPDGSVNVCVRGEPTEVEGKRVCGQTCLPGGPHCNNYCNLAPGKGPMASSPEKHTYLKEGVMAVVRLSAEDWAKLLEQAQTLTYVDNQKSASFSAGGIG